MSHIMKIFRSVWMALGKPMRAAIRTAVRDEVQTVVTQKVVPIVAQKIDEKLPGVGPIMGAVIASQIQEHLSQIHD